MRKLLLTGANGFVGRHFLDKYNGLYDIKTFSFLHDDVSDLSLGDMEIVVHLSALVHQMSGDNIKEYDRINVEQTLLLANKAKLYGVRHFVFMSTVKVYGEGLDGLTYTENSSCNPEDGYGRSKLNAEMELKKLCDDSFNVSIIRSPVVYGYGVKGNIKNLVNLVNTLPIIPLNGIYNKRSMVYIGNLCYLINEIMVQKKPGIFLASDDEAIGTSKLIELIAKQLNKKIFLIKFPFLKMVLRVLKPAFHNRIYGNLAVDSSITKKRLNLINPYSVEQGIEFMIKGEN